MHLDSGGSRHPGVSTTWVCGLSQEGRAETGFSAGSEAIFLVISLYYPVITLNAGWNLANAMHKQNRSSGKIVLWTHLLVHYFFFWGSEHVSLEALWRCRFSASFKIHNLITTILDTKIQTSKTSDIPTIQTSIWVMTIDLNAKNKCLKAWMWTPLVRLRGWNLWSLSVPLGVDEFNESVHCTAILAVDIYGILWLFGPTLGKVFRTFSECLDMDHMALRVCEADDCQCFDSMAQLTKL